MDPITAGALISAGGSLLGGLFGSDSARDAARQNARAQKEFAQHGIRWRVADAKAAGLHPLYALGAQTPSFSPVHVQSPMGDAISQAGQHIGRGIQAKATSQEQQLVRLEMMEKLSRIRENDARAALINQELHDLQQKGPKFPGVNTPESSVIPSVVPQDQVGSHPYQGMVKVKPAEVTAGSGVPGITAGVPEGFTKIRMPGDWHMLLPSQDLSEPLESAGEIVSPLVIAAANIAWLGGRASVAMKRKIYEAAYEYVKWRKSVQSKRIEPSRRYQPNREW